MLRRAGVLTVLAALGCTPYSPPCHLEPSRTISDAHGRLVAHAGGRVSWLDLRLGPARDAGFDQTAVVSAFFADGEPAQPPYSVQLPPAASNLEALLNEPVDFPGGVACARTAVAPDGGAEAVVELRRADGGSATASFPLRARPFLPAQLDQAGALVQVNPREGDVYAVDLDGAVVATRHLASGEELRPGGDALAVFPGPVLLDPSLSPLSTAPDSPLAAQAIAWDLAAGRVTLGSVVADDLLFDRLDLAGQRSPTERVSSGTFVLGLATGARGTGVVFAAPFPEEEDGGAFGFQLWFAFVDHQGKKRGPDLPLPFAPSAFGSAPPLVPSGPQDFTFFTPSGAGLDAIPVRCDGIGEPAP